MDVMDVMKITVYNSELEPVADKDVTIEHHKGYPKARITGYWPIDVKGFREWYNSFARKEFYYLTKGHKVVSINLADTIDLLMTRYEPE